MRVDLRLRLRAADGEAESVDRPVQIALASALAQRQEFADRRLVDLNDFDAGLLQVGDSSRTASAICSAVSYIGWSWRTNERASIVTGPVRMP